MSISKEYFGTTKKNEVVDAYVITNGKGNYIKVITYGATVVDIVVSDRNGVKRDVCLGYDTLEEYENNGGYLGAFIGRVGNRTNKGEFIIDGVTYHIEKNEADRCNLHGGTKGFNSKVLTAKQRSDNSVAFTCISPDGEGGFPGELTATVTYTFDDNDCLTMSYEAVADKKTPINLTNHAYFDLSGGEEKNILNQILQINADTITAVDAACIPTGDFMDVTNTPFDFRCAKKIGAEIDEPHEQIQMGHGYDHNFVLRQGEAYAAKAWCETTGIEMTVITDLPGVQFYAGNFIGDLMGKNGKPLCNRKGFCLETQYFPDSLNQPNFETPVTEAGEKYETVTKYQFGIK